MKTFKETTEEAASRLWERTLLSCLLFAFIGVNVSVTQKWVEGWESLGTYHEVEGPLAFGFGVAISAWSFAALWICYFRHYYLVAPHMRSEMICFLLLVGICLTVSVLPNFISMARPYQIVSKASIFVLLISAHFFHKRVKSVVAKFTKHREGNRQND